MSGDFCQVRILVLACLPVRSYLYDPLKALYITSGMRSSNIKRAYAGDEVLEWNGRTLEHKSYDEVHDVIAESRYDSQVELRVSRMLSAPGAGAAGMPGIGGHPIRGGPVTSRSLAVPTGTRIQVREVIHTQALLCAFVRIVYTAWSLPWGAWLPFMTSALRGEGGTFKSRHSKQP